jgi:hypothetical protein
MKLLFGAKAAVLDAEKALKHCLVGMVYQFFGNGFRTSCGRVHITARTGGSLPAL